MRTPLDDEVERLQCTSSPASLPNSANVESQGNIEIGGSVVGRDQTGESTSRSGHTAPTEHPTGSDEGGRLVDQGLVTFLRIRWA